MTFPFEKYLTLTETGPLVPLPAGLPSRLDILSAELLRWNQTHNLTGHRDETSVALDLILDALCLVPHIKGGSLLDIGSGAGFPGLVLALAAPGLSVTLLEARAKRISFMKHAIRVLGLGDRTQAVRGRAGEGALSGKKYDTVTCRALGGLEQSLGLAREYAATGGRIILPRGTKDQDRAQELKMKVVPYELPAPYGRRILALADCFT